MSLLSLLLIQSHCSSDPECSSRVQISSQADPQMSSGALIHVPRYLGNLPFRVWKKMQDIVQNSESDYRRSELAYTHTGNDAILTDFGIMCEEPDHLLHQNQQLTFRNNQYQNSVCLTFISSPMQETKVISAVFKTLYLIRRTETFLKKKKNSYYIPYDYCCFYTIEIIY